MIKNVVLYKIYLNRTFKVKSTPVKDKHILKLVNRMKVGYSLH